MVNCTMKIFDGGLAYRPGVFLILGVQAGISIVKIALIRPFGRKYYVPCTTDNINVTESLH